MRKPATLLAAGLSVAILTATLQSSPVSAQQSETDTRYEPCAPDTLQVDIVFTLDQSGSMRAVDGDGDERRRAVREIRNGLAEEKRRLEELEGVDIRIGLVGFNSEARVHAHLAPIGDNYPTDEQIEAALTSAGDTDYGAALDAALREFRSSPAAGNTCRLFVFVTDGVYDPAGTVTSSQGAAREDDAKEQGDNLLRSVCREDEEQGRQIADMKVRTYAVLIGDQFGSTTAGRPHREAMALLSRQFVLALTGDTESEVLAGTALHPSCIQAQEEGRAITPEGGVVISIANIEMLVSAVKELGEELEEELDLAARRPELDCDTSAPVTAQVLEDEGSWPGEAHAQGVCRLKMPADGHVELSVRYQQQAGQDSLRWEIDVPDYGRGEQVTVSGPPSQEVPVSLLAEMGADTETPATFSLRVGMVWQPDVSPGDSPAASETTERSISVTVPSGGAEAREKAIQDLIRCDSAEASPESNGGDWSDIPLRVDTGCVAHPPPIGEATFSGESSSGEPEWDAGDEFSLRPGDQPRPFSLSIGALPNDDWNLTGQVEFTAIWEYSQRAGIIERATDNETLTVTVSFSRLRDKGKAWLIAAGLLGGLLLLAWVAWLLLRRNRMGSPRGWTWAQHDFSLPVKNTDEDVLNHAEDMGKHVPVRHSQGVWVMGDLSVSRSQSLWPWSAPRVRVTAEQCRLLAACQPPGRSAGAIRWTSGTRCFGVLATDSDNTEAYMWLAVKQSHMTTEGLRMVAESLLWRIPHLTSPAASQEEQPSAGEEESTADTDPVPPGTPDSDLEPPPFNS